MEPLTSNEKRISWKRRVLEFQSQMSFLGYTLSFSASTPFLLAPWNGFHFLHASLLCFSPAPSSPKSKAPSCKESCPVFVLPISTELFLLCLPWDGYFYVNPSHILSYVWFLSRSSVPCSSSSLLPYSHTPCIFGFSLSGFVSFQPINLYKALSSWNVLLMLHCYPVCLSFQTQVSWKSHQHALFLHPHILFIS